ncbi:helix-turn-helix domain-containing protein [Persicobacter diffluens]|uniref:Transcriptional regulator n=1 Tax=Persicobacter diffluens TaxID=981 RepID=A0AAN5AKZ1_9BACT|nr:transcriptional regulator [Persicobacter diffluens]
MINKIPYNFDSHQTIEYSNVYAQVLEVETIDDGFIGRFEEYGLFHVIEGEGSIQLDFDEFQVKQNDIIIAGPGQMIQNINIEGGKVCFITVQNQVSMEVWRSMETLHVLNPVHAISQVNMTDEESATIAHLSQKITEVHQQENHFAEVLLKCFITEILVSVENAVRRAGHDTEGLKAITARFFSLFFLNNSHERKVSFYAEQLDITPNYLNIAVKKGTGKNVKHFINEMILTDAKRLLKFTDMDAKQIAFELDFDSPAYFNYFFKKETSITPLDYRKKERK